MADEAVRTIRRPSRPWRVAYLVTHPIPYQVPLLRRISADPDIDLTVFFESDYTLHQHLDVEFGREIEWDVPLLGGYKHVFLDRWKFVPVPPLGFGFWGPYNRGFGAMLDRNRFDALWVHGYSRVHHLQAMVQARMKGLKVLLRDEMAEMGRARSAVRSRMKQTLFAGLDKFIDGYLTIGSRNEQHCHALGLDRRRMFRVCYTVDNPWFQARLAESAGKREELRRSLGLEPGRPIVLYVAKLIARKAPFDLLKAFANLQDRPDSGRPYLLMAGDGDMRPEIEIFLRERRLDAVKLLGFQNQRELAGLYDLCDLFVLPSARESWGLVVNEVMNAGRAVITSDRVCSSADLVHSGRNGDVYRFGDIDQLTGQMRDSLAAPERLAALGRESRRIIDTWDYEQNVIGLRAALASTVGLDLAA
jgi:glycosyltransferase involved in cell wall biosynthesis